MSISIESSKYFGYNFVEEKFLLQNQNEYSRRFLQNPKDTYRHLTQSEIDALEKNNNHCDKWQDVLVEDPFLPNRIKNNVFVGLVRIGAMKDALLKHHDFVINMGITNNTIISSDIGSCAAVHNCPYISHYIIEDNVVLSRVDELSATDHAKFGEGIVKCGENEDVRITIDVINENGNRYVFPFRSMLIADAYIWAKYRGDSKLIKKLEEFTQSKCDSSRGYYGVVSRGAAIKSCRIIKDVFIGEFSYIKGANKLKNLTILSSENEPSQIGEGVELVNGIIGYASRIFYGVKAVRFVIGSHCTLKYGARLIHSILGDNSTISCCEVLNTLIFPFHEQHHNNSFLIAAMIMGQSNMAAGATVGSNHNTRGNDGEIVAGRGFWPGLSISLKHNCKFASFILISKGSYRYELNIPFPFALIIDNEKEDVLEIMPAYYWMYNMYALERNMKKFAKRDKRIDKSFKIETDYLAPDTAAEILNAINFLDDVVKSVDKKDIIIKDEKVDIIYAEPKYIEKSRRRIKFVKIERAIESYKEMLVYYAVKTLCIYFECNNLNFPNFVSKIKQSSHLDESLLDWVNVGGLLMPKPFFDTLTSNIKDGVLNTWDDVHNEYIKIAGKLEYQKVLNAYFVLLKLSDSHLDGTIWNAFIDHAVSIRYYIKDQVYKTKYKDYSSFFREITYDTIDEMNAVLKKIEDDEVIKDAALKSFEYVSLFKKYKVDL